MGLRCSLVDHLRVLIDRCAGAAQASEGCLGDGLISAREGAVDAHRGHRALILPGAQPEVEVALRDPRFRRGETKDGFVDRGQTDSGLLRVALGVAHLDRQPRVLAGSVAWLLGRDRHVDHLTAVNVHQAKASVERPLGAALQRTDLDPAV